MNFYVYVYLDPRKPGKYCYNNISFLYEPFYIGKGKGKRHLDHLRYIQREQNIHFKKKLRKILIFSDIEKYIVILNNSLSESEAFEFETYLIKDIGRFDLGLGPLTNHTDGGEGFSGRKNHPRGMLNKHHSEEAREKIRLAHLGEKNAMFRDHLSQEILEKMRIQRTGKNNPMFGKSLSEETRDKISKALKEKNPRGMLGKRHSIETKRKMSEKLIGRSFSEETKEKIRQSNLGKRRSEITKERVRQANLGEKSSLAKLRTQQVHQIHMLLKLGYKTIDISQKYNVQAQTIKSIDRGQTWKQVYKFFVGGDSIE